MGQEWLAYGDCYLEPSLFFWETDKKGNTAEIDFLTQLHGTIVPIEVKAGGKGQLRSLLQFMEMKKAPLGIHISQAPLAIRGNILSVPIYLIEEIPRLVQSLESMR